MAHLLTLQNVDTHGIHHVSTSSDIAGNDISDGAANPFYSLLGPDWAAKRILLAMNHTSYIDSAAIGWLIMCQREFKKSGGAMVLFNVPESVLQVLALLKIQKFIPVAANESAARLMLSQQQVGNAAIG